MKRFIKIMLTFLSVMVLCALGVSCKKDNNSDGNVNDKVNIKETKISIEVGESFSLTLEGADGEEISWSSDNPLVAGVDETGKITGLSEGFCVIKATVGEDSDSCNIEVVEATESEQKPFPQLILSQTMVDMVVGTSFPVNGAIYYDGIIIKGGSKVKE